MAWHLEHWGKRMEPHHNHWLIARNQTTTWFGSPAASYSNGMQRDAKGRHDKNWSGLHVSLQTLCDACVPTNHRHENRWGLCDHQELYGGFKGKGKAQDVGRLSGRGGSDPRMQGRSLSFHKWHYTSLHSLHLIAGEIWLGLTCPLLLCQTRGFSIVLTGLAREYPILFLKFILMTKWHGHYSSLQVVQLAWIKCSWETALSAQQKGMSLSTRDDSIQSYFGSILVPPILGGRGWVS